MGYSSSDDFFYATLFNLGGTYQIYASYSFNGITDEITTTISPLDSIPNNLQVVYNNNVFNVYYNGTTNNNGILIPDLCSSTKIPISTTTNLTVVPLITATAGVVVGQWTITSVLQYGFQIGTFQSALLPSATSNFDINLNIPVVKSDFIPSIDMAQTEITVNIADSQGNNVLIGGSAFIFNNVCTFANGIINLTASALVGSNYGIFQTDFASNLTGPFIYSIYFCMPNELVAIGKPSGTLASYTLAPASILTDASIIPYLPQSSILKLMSINYTNIHINNSQPVFTQLYRFAFPYPATFFKLNLYNFSFSILPKTQDSGATVSFGFQIGELDPVHGTPINDGNAFSASFSGLSIGTTAKYTLPPYNSLDLWYYTETPITNIILSFIAYGNQSGTGTGALTADFTRMTMQGLLSAHDYQNSNIGIIPIST